jgi:hypothetical protein
VNSALFSSVQIAMAAPGRVFGNFSPVSITWISGNWFRTIAVTCWGSQPH